MRWFVEGQGAFSVFLTLKEAGWWIRGANGASSLLIGGRRTGLNWKRTGPGSLTASEWSLPDEEKVFALARAAAPKGIMVIHLSTHLIVRFGGGLITGCLTMAILACRLMSTTAVKGGV